MINLPVGQAVVGDRITLVGDERVSRCTGCQRLVRLHWERCPDCALTLTHGGNEWLYHKTWLLAPNPPQRPARWDRLKARFHLRHPHSAAH